MPKTLLRLIKRAQKHIFAKALYFTKDTHSNKEEQKKTAIGGPSNPA